MHPSFERIPFREPAKAAKDLDTILEGDTGSLEEGLAEAIRDVADPDSVLVRMERFLCAAATPQIQRDLMCSTPRYLHLLCTIFDQSHYLTDIVLRNPGYTLWLWEEAPLGRAMTREEVVAELGVQVAAFDTFGARCASLRRFKRREFLRIATRDIFEYEPLASITEDLSNLADAMLDVAIRCGEDDLRGRFGEPISRDSEGVVAKTRFAVLAMGKLGGRELNFSSDIDLVFLYSDDGETTGGTSGRLTNAEYFQRLCERVISAISEQTAEGHVFRVDVRLRPHGRVGPLAVTIDSALRYYEQAGRAWERQALLKIRPSAGDRAFGEEFIERTRPFVFPRYFDDETLEDILDVKRQTEARIAERGVVETDVKQGRGGIRDIEFTVQMLQLLNGGRVADLRAPSTLGAIRALGDHGILSTFEATTLESNYLFLRQIEHRIQIEGSQQRHELPQDPDRLDALARRLGYASGASLVVTFRERAEETRAILDRFLSVKGAGNLWIADLLDAQSSGAAAIEHLQAMGFRDPAKARAELLALGAGTRDRPFSQHIRHRFAEIAPALIRALSESADPDGILIRLGRILHNIKAPTAIYDILKSNPELPDNLVTLVANSEYLTEILIRDPGLFELFGSSRAAGERVTREELEAQLADLERAYDKEAAPYRLRDGELLRIGMRELFENCTVIQVGHELSRLAEVCLAYVLAKARARAAERFGPPTAPFAVLALGKLGGCEMGYGSDLDLVFVYGREATGQGGVSPTEYYAAIASQTLRALKEPTRYGSLYDVDARLRPDGNKGMLTITDERLEDYYANEAQAWERLALVKVRAVAGDMGFATSVEARARDLAFALPLTRETIEAVEGIRKRIVAGAAALDLKKGEGGIAEIEFAVRLLQLYYGARFGDLRRGDVVGAFDALARNGIVSSEDFDDLTSAYFLLRKVENRVRMMHGRSGSALPATPEAWEDLARRLRFSSNLAEVVVARQARAHAAYGRVLKTVLGSG
ncbi:MAG TPA: bifunctional [glutamate--ammonia ligase]-adenylyl-L-tyrosine phosphorylase/[glutamate--ammonia-ligase] adenylyltransferase [Candidatus Hydrogenedentes bacterium]|nr:bifunctional [glutamate--ammonia ligase]-adenylyl-L-tyrosine phosphorylase/[glutamate--ammonia-ligase] adenylyltransferase [Candidatus Hydrogenedentota bacterium]HPG69559.1 bifunctional [glutamate--ammonia ligase]-adenylyl-L-tyrosine phosphorylase/[glutamate--ammonia-ligase] adenylyltransferase [Candidatus Hydrogenedentota bacterium]